VLTREFWFFRIYSWWRFGLTKKAKQLDQGIGRRFAVAFERVAGWAQFLVDLTSRRLPASRVAGTDN
jgi:hypothetical protein